MSPLLRFLKCEGGSTAVEFSLIMVVMLMLFLGIIEFGRAFYLYNKVSFAMDRAARIGITNPDSSDQQLTNEILAEFPASETASSGQMLSDLRPTIEITAVDTPSGTDYRVVTARMLFKPLIPNLVEKQFTLSVSRRVPKVT